MYILLDVHNKALKKKIPSHSNTEPVKVYVPPSDEIESKEVVGGVLPL